MFFRLQLLGWIAVFLLVGCRSPQRLSELDPTIIPELRGNIHLKKMTYDIGEAIRVEYWLTNSSDKRLEAQVVDGSPTVDVPFQGYHFNAVSVQQADRHLALKQAGAPFHGELKLVPGQKVLFAYNFFEAKEAGPYVLSFELRWANKKRVTFKPVTIAIQSSQPVKAAMDPALEKALLQLASASHQERTQAREMLVKLGSLAASALVELLGHQNLQLRSEAMLLLIAMKQDSIAVLMSNTSHPNREVRMRVVYALGEIGEIQALSAISKLLTQDEDKDIRVTALRAIAKNFIDRIAVPLMITALQDAHQDVRAAAIEALAGRTPPELNFGFQPAGPPEERERAIARWNQWWEHEETNFK